MFGGIVLILLCQLVGTFLAAAVHLPVPGPVVGMVIFLGLLLWKKPEDDSHIVKTAEGFLKYMPLFFVPAGVGIVVYLPDLIAQWVPVTVGLIGSWLMALLTTAGVALIFHKRQTKAAK